MKYLGILIFILAFFIFLITLCPTIYVEDAGELTAAAYTLGIPHPPGYPLYSIIGKLFTVFIPIANIAYRINIMSAVFASLTVLLLYLLIIRLAVSAERLANTEYHIPHTVNFIAFAASLCFAFSNTFWTCAISAEVYALNAFFVILTLYLLIANSSLFFFTFIYGLSLTNHHSMILLFPIYLIYIFISCRPEICLPKGRKKNRWMTVILFFLLGLCLYLYLPIRAFSHPPINWGNPDNFIDSIDHIARKQYGKFTAMPYSISLFSKQLILYIKGLAGQFQWTLFPLIFIAAAGLFKYKKIFFLLISSFLVFSIGTIIMLNYKITPEYLSIVEVFFIPSYLIVSILLGIGCRYIFSQLSKKYLFYPAIIIILFLLVIYPVFSNYNYNNQSENYIAYEFGKNILKTAKNNDILLLSGDNQLFSLTYLKIVENYAKDLKIFEDTGKLFPTINDKAFIENALYKHELIYVPPWSPWNKFILGNKIKLDVNGLLYNLSYEPQAVDSAVFWKNYNFRNINTNVKNYDIFNRMVIVQYYYMMGEWNYDRKQFNRAFHYFELAKLCGYDMEKFHYNLGFFYSINRMTDLAISEYVKALEIDGSYSFAHNNLGEAYFAKGIYEKAITEFKAAISSDINNMTAYNNLGSTYANLEKYDLAKNVWRQGLKINPAYSPIINNLKKLQ